MKILDNGLKAKNEYAKEHAKKMLQMFENTTPGKSQQGFYTFFELDQTDFLDHDQQLKAELYVTMLGKGNPYVNTRSWLCKQVAQSASLSMHY